MTDIDREIIDRAREGIRWGLKGEVNIKGLLDIIDRLQSEREALIAGQETLQKCIAEKNAEIEELREINKSIKDDRKYFFATTIKEFAERLKEKFKGIVSEPTNEQFDWILHDYVPRKIDNLVKELTEGSND